MNPRRIVGILTFLMLFNTGALLAKDDELSSAQGIERYKNLLQTHPEEADYWNALGYYYLKSEDLQRAKAHFVKAIELDGSYPVPHNNLGVVYLKQGLYEQAEQEFRRAVRLNPHYCKAQYNLAVALFHQKRYMEAGKAYLEARDLDRDYVARRNNRENMERKIEKALEEVDGDDQSTQELKRMRQWFAPYY